MSALRPLPPRPSLEFEHKEAKALLRRLLAGDPDSLARAQARDSAIDAAAPARIKLAAAQLVIAREYGFASWPRLVRFFGDVERQRHSQRLIRSQERGYYDGSVRGLLDGHRGRRVWAGSALASYVPRFYGLRAADVFASPITDDESRMAVARSNGFPSWEALLERLEAEDRQRHGVSELAPIRDASRAIEARNLEELKRVVEANPELLHPSGNDVIQGRTLVRSVIHHERRQGVAAMRPIIDWLATQGLDHQRELTLQLCGHRRMSAEKVRWLLDRGADPSWVADNGIPVLEHALIRNWNGETTDLIAARTAPRQALWIAAGLGDVESVRRSLDARGKPRRAARRLRPDFVAVGQSGMSISHPDAEDEEILMEAFLIAMTNGRTAVLEYMVSRGFPLDSLAWESPLISFAVGNGMTTVVECLVRCGADLDLRGMLTGSPRSAREIARVIFADNPHNATCRRIVELCGMDPDSVDRPPQP